MEALSVLRLIYDDQNRKSPFRITFSISNDGPLLITNDDFDFSVRCGIA